MSLIPERARAELVRAYTAPDRHYHDLRHIETLLDLARLHATALDDADAVEAAIWFHDAIYDTRRHDNEARSATFAIECLAGGASANRIDRIAAMIRATAGHAVPDLADDGARRDCALFLDMDLAILGSPQAAFAAYEEAVRREYAWVPEPLWISGRRQVLERFLARPAIYASPQFRASHEVLARKNLAQALAGIASAERSPSSAGN